MQYARLTLVTIPVQAQRQPARKLQKAEGPVGGQHTSAAAKTVHSPMYQAQIEAKSAMQVSWGKRHYMHTPLLTCPS